MKIAITGGDGFLGRHLRVRLRAQGHQDVVTVTRADLHSPEALARTLTGAEAIFHLSGANRGEPKFVETENAALAGAVIQTLDHIGASPRLVYANSVHASSETPYGRGKRAAGDVFAAWSARQSSAYVDLLLPNLFGEGGRPDYNSFVATFCDRLARGNQPEILTDRTLELLHAQDAAQQLITCLTTDRSGTVAPHSGTVTSVSEVLTLLRRMAADYTHGVFPDLSARFTRQLFNTYRSYLYPSTYPFRLLPHADQRGVFVESIRCRGGVTQTSYSTTAPGVTRGNHFHLEKVERFQVLHGDAVISIRHVLGQTVDRFQVSGDRPAFVDIPTLHTHNIVNLGSSDLLTLFWVDEFYDETNPDTFPEEVG